MADASHEAEPTLDQIERSLRKKEIKLAKLKARDILAKKRLAQLEARSILLDRFKGGARPRAIVETPLVSRDLEARAVIMEAKRLLTARGHNADQLLHENKAGIVAAISVDPSRFAGPSVAMNARSLVRLVLKLEKRRRHS